MQLAVCAKLIEGRSQDLINLAGDLLPPSGIADSSTIRSAYFRAVSPGAGISDSADAAGNQGAINDQSLVTLFEYEGVKMVFGGDMQFEKPQVSDVRVGQEMEKLLNALADQKPYDLVKLSHHGSDNGFSEALWQRLGKPVLMGMCAGEGSKSHPNPKVLHMLEQHTDAVQWARTDHNGQTTFTFGGNKPKIDVTRGELNDPVPNSADVIAQRTGTQGFESTLSVQRETKDEIVEVTARIPHKRTRVRYLTRMRLW